MDDTPDTCYFIGRDHLVHCRYTEAVAKLEEGHRNGDCSCSAELARCYLHGYGVPVDFHRFYALAKELEIKRCPLAYCLLASACADGICCKVDPYKAEYYLNQWLEAAARTIPGVWDECRLVFKYLGLNVTMSRLALTQQISDKKNRKQVLDDLIQSVISFTNQSRFADRCITKATAWLMAHDEKELPPGELVEELRLATKAKVFESQEIYAELLLRQHPEPDEQVLNTVRKLILIDDPCPGCGALLLALKHSDSDSERKYIVERLFQSLQHGRCGLVRPQELPCQLSISTPKIAGVLSVPHLRVMQRLHQDQEIQRVYNLTGHPVLHIRNTSSRELSELTLRIIIPGKHELLVPVADVLPAQEQAFIDLNDHINEPATQLRLELRDKALHYTSMELEEEVLQLYEPVPVPVICHWEQNDDGKNQITILSLNNTPLCIDILDGEGTPRYENLFLSENGPIVIPAENLFGTQELANQHFCITSQDYNHLVCKIIV